MSINILSMSSLRGPLTNPPPLAPPPPPKHRLSGGNSALKDALSTAIGALFLLDEAGSTIIDIDVRGGTPVLRIDHPPCWVRGVATVRRTVGNHTERLFAAPFHGAQLEWSERLDSVGDMAVAS